MNPWALALIVFALGLLPFAATDFAVNGLDLLTLISFILGALIQRRHTNRKAHR